MNVFRYRISETIQWSIYVFAGVSFTYRAAMHTDLKKNRQRYGENIFKYLIYFNHVPPNSAETKSK